MKTSEKGIALIKKFEGLRLEAYKPVKTEKEYTIGYGHYGVKAGTKITAEEAEKLLKKDLKKYENYVAATKLKLNQNQYDALVSFTFNCGSGCLQTLVKNRTIEEIGNALTRYNKAGGKALEGLTKRRKAEKELFFTPIEEEIVEQETTEPEKNSLDKLPCKVKTKCALNVRTAAGTNYPVIRTTKKGEILTIWAILTSGGVKWGKNDKEWYCLDYCEVV